MPFEEFKEKRGRGRYGFPVVTIMRSGGIGFNGEAHDAMGKPDRIVLAFDPETRRIGLRGAKRNEYSHSYPIHSSSEHSMWVSGRSFLRYYDIVGESTTRYRAASGEGFLVIDLSEPPLRQVRKKERGGDDAEG